MKNLKRFSVVCERPAQIPAAPSYGQTLVQVRESDEALFNRAHSLASMGQHAEAVTLYRRLDSAIGKFPWLPLNLGASLVSLGRWDEAAEAFAWATRTQPDNPVAHGNLGAVLGHLKRNKEALPHLCRAVQLAPTDLSTVLNLVRALHALRHVEVVSVAESAVLLAPESVEAWRALGDAQLLFGAPEKALASYEKVEAKAPGSLNDSNNLGLALFRTGRHQESTEFFKNAVQTRPQNADAWCELGLAFLHGGDVPPAVECLRRSVDLDPENEYTHSNFLLSMCYSPDHSPQTLLSESKAWAARHAPAGKELPAIKVAEREKLRIGYLSADFHAHPAGYLYEAMFPFHDRSRFEIFAYSTKDWSDDVTRRIQNSVDRWIIVQEDTETELAQRIQNDQVDILIDLLGHTPGHRLKAMGRHPAPVQATWLGYFGTTGMSQMDYIISDRVVLPEDDEANYTERPAHMPGCLYVFQPPKLPIEANALPALTNGHFTFGCFNNLAKITPEVVALWCEILQAMPESRMILNRWPLDSQASQRKYAALFAANGVDPSRVEFRATKGRENYFRGYHDVDLILDTFPFGGGTTTSESLWMGVPVVSVSTDRLPGRMSESILRTVGIPELIPSDKADYVRLALELANNLPCLASLRTSLRDQVETSPLCDVKSYTRDLESVFEWMWQNRSP